MRLIALLLLPALNFAAPVPKQGEKTIEVKLYAKNQLVLEVTIQNNGKERIDLPYRFSPMEHLAVELQGDQGKTHKIEYQADEDEKETPGTLSIPAGKSKTFSIHTCHSLPELGERQRVTFTARLKHDGKTIESEPLTVKP